MLWPISDIHDAALGIFAARSYGILETIHERMCRQNQNAVGYDGLIFSTSGH